MSKPIHIPFVSEVWTYRTSDGRIFETRQGAERHQAEMALIDWFEKSVSSHAERDDVIAELLGNIDTLAPALRKLLPPDEG